MRLKYIVVADSCPVVFPEALVHADVGRGFNVTSAGFCERLDSGNWDCWGESLSLGMTSKASDGELLTRTFEN